MADSIAVRARPIKKTLPSRCAAAWYRATQERRPLAEAVLFSVALSLLFVLVYGGCNALASRRTDLGVCFFAWELRIPFVPAFIVPYMSIDLFFVASFLLCADRIELRAHARRITLAILIAGLAFLVVPLTTGYPRPELGGWIGKLFEFLRSFDKPHNLAPSLHVALASLLWPVYARRRSCARCQLVIRPLHTHCRLRWFVHVWFALIIASPLFTWQHHLLDVASGGMLAQVCLFAFPERPDRDRSGARGRSAIRALVVSEPNLRVARFYAIGSAALGFLAIALGSWFCLLLWPAASLALISIAYVRGNSSVFRKANGRLPISTRVVLGPYLCGAFVRLLMYRPRREPCAEAAPRVYCGRLLTKREALAMRVTGLTGVLDLTAEHAETRTFLEIDSLNTAARKLQEIAYLNVPVLDLTAPSRKQLDAAVAFIAEHARRGGVYVHCALGISRSVAAVTAYIASQRVEPPLNNECADFRAREKVTKISATSRILP
ncbi:MAG TPA: dual specificity protein phosphatase family protein [Blastocatellia bacterium]|nr:dual specificity protein phosphatase family protein [Blastocatellia bacterium]